MADAPLELFIRQWGPAGLLSLVIISIMFGVLVPVRFYRDIKQQRDEWQRTATEALRQNTKLLESAHVADTTFSALKSVVENEADAR